MVNLMRISNMANKSHQVKRDRRIFSIDEKQKLYQQWKLSGVNKNQFCKQNDLVASAFSKWCRKFSSNETISTTQSNWVPVISKNEISELPKSPTLIEIKISNPTKIIIFLFMLSLVLVLKEMFHAIKVIW